MQLVLGVAITDSVARLALVDASNLESVVDRFEVAVSAASTGDLVRTIRDTDRALNTDGHRLTATNICWSDQTHADTLRIALAGAVTGSVSVVSATDAATALVRTAAGGAGEQTSALLLVDNATAALSVVGPDAATTSLIDAESIQAGSDAACTAMLERLREEPGGAQTLYVLSTSGDAAALTDRLRPDAPIPLYAAAEPAYLLARGAAVAYSAPAADQAATAMGPVQGQHLAYSLADDSGSLPIGVPEEYDDAGAPFQVPMAPLSNTAGQPTYYDDPNEFEAPVGAGASRPRVLLMGSTIAAIVVVGFAVLAVGVAITIKPTVSQQAIRDYEAVPGKYLPTMPGQGIEPVEDAAAYLPPVVPVEAVAPPSGTPAVYTGGGNGGSGGARGTSGSYSTSAGNTGGLPGVGGGGVPVAPGVRGGGNAFDALALADFIGRLIPDLPGNITFNVPNGAIGCDLSEPLCQIRIFGCIADRPGCDKKIAGILDGLGWTAPKTDDIETPPDMNCALSPAAATCAPTDATELGVETTKSDPESPADNQRSASTDESDDTSNDTTDSNTEGDTDEGSPEQQADEDPEAPKPAENTSTTVTSSPTSTEPGPTTEGSSPPETSTTTSEAPEPETTSSRTPPSSSPSAPKPEPTPERKTTSAAPPPPPAPKPAPEPPVQAPPPPAPKPAPAPPVQAPPPPAPEPEPVYVPEPAPAPEPVYVPEPAPAPAPAPAAEPVYVPEPVEAPSSSSGSSSSSSDSGSSSSSDSSDSSPVTTEASAP